MFYVVGARSGLGLLFWSRISPFIALVLVSGFCSIRKDTTERNYHEIELGLLADCVLCTPMLEHGEALYHLRLLVNAASSGFKEASYLQHSSFATSVLDFSLVNAYMLLSS